MEALPKVAVESLLPVVREQVEEAVKQIMEAVNQTRPGELITGSEEAARDIGQELTRAIYQAALQQRVTAAEAAFSPSAGGANGPAAPEPWAATPHGAVHRGACQSAPHVVALSHERQRRAAGGVDHGGWCKHDAGRAGAGRPAEQRCGQLRQGGRPPGPHGADGNKRRPLRLLVEAEGRRVMEVQRPPGRRGGVESPARVCSMAVRNSANAGWRRALSKTSVIGPVRPSAAIFRRSSHIVSVFTTAVLVTAISSRVTPQHVEPRPSRGGPHEAPRERPQAAQEGTEHEVRRIDEEHVSFTG